MTSIAHLDFEVSGVGDLRKVGADAWTRRRDTYPTVLSFILDQRRGVYPATLPVLDHRPVHTFVFDKVHHHRSTANVEFWLNLVTDKDTEIHAWNASFEYLVWNNICVPRYKWPALPLEKFHCTMARAACAGLPMSLDQAAQVMQTGYLKDMVGARNMKRMARPRRNDPDHPTEWWHLAQDTVAQTNIDDLIAYNRSDVEAERSIYEVTPNMTEAERRIWLIDQRMQLAGLPIDKDLLDRLSKITEIELNWFNTLLDANTAGEVTSHTQNARLIAWLNARGYQLSTLEKEAVSAYLRSPEFRRLPPIAQDVLKLRAEAAKTSTAKLGAIREFAQIDGRCRFLSQYGGAVRTLRWAGRGPQIQNFPRPTIKDVGDAIDYIKAGGDTEGMGLVWGKPLEVVASCLRGVFCAPPGMKFVVCDYSAIEARVVAWLADHGDLLAVFARGEDPYVYAAQQQGSDDRQFGKVLILACGYGMGGPKFQETALKYGVELTISEAMRAVAEWRDINWPITNLWTHYQQQATFAILRPGSVFASGNVKFRMARPDGRLKGSLLMELPSKRNLVYRNARLENNDITYDGVNQYTRKWETIRTYGGKLVENATQAIARDLLADAIVDLDKIGWGDALRQTVHDEIIAEVKEDDAQLLRLKMEWVMEHPPQWANGLPLAVTSYVNQRYTKG